MDQYFKQLYLPDRDIRILPLMQKDGSKMGEFDRRVIVDMVGVLLREKAPIVITHSFAGIVQTGCFLDRELPKPNVPIVLTCATRISDKEKDDGLQNLSVSLSATRVLDPGVFIVLHRRALPLSRASKTSTLDDIPPLDGILGTTED